MLQQEMGNWF